MALDHSLTGVPADPVEKRWGADEVLRYALGVGAGAGDPTTELAFTTENSAGVTLRALPTFGVLVNAVRSGRRLGDFDPAMLVHAEQAVELHGPLPAQGCVSVVSTVRSIQDKGSGALVRSEAVATDPSGTAVVTTRSGVFIRGEGGFGGERVPEPGWSPPDGPPDREVRYRTAPDQALRYRLTGDRNPLHSDPAFAARAGFPRPILHGLCTYGFTGRALLHALCDGDPDRLRGMEGRFSRPVLPGDDLVISVWRIGDGEALFRTATGDGTVVIDRGRARFH